MKAQSAIHQARGVLSECDYIFNSSIVCTFRVFTLRPSKGARGWCNQPHSV